MHDPMTVAFEIRYPWRKYGDNGRSDFERNYRESFITIWHVDPEKRGSDDSCDWFGHKRPLNERETALWHALDDLFHTLGNRPFYPDARLWGTEPHGDDPSLQGPVQAVERAMYEWRRRSKWRIPVRWHVWHWSIQVHPLQQFKRWAFSRCTHCGGRFAWGEQVIGYSWHGTGPRWFRSEERIAHERCDAIHVVTSAPSVPPEKERAS